MVSNNLVLASALNFQLPSNKLTQPIELYLSLICNLWKFAHFIYKVTEMSNNKKLQENSWETYNRKTRNTSTVLIFLK